MTLDELPWEANEAFFPETYRVARWPIGPDGKPQGFIEKYLDRPNYYRIVNHRWRPANREALDALTAQCLVHQILAELEKAP
jgi:hypothetical protein